MGCEAHLSSLSLTSGGQCLAQGITKLPVAEGLVHLRALRPKVPVLLATGRIDQTALTLAAAHPGVTLLPKPFAQGAPRNSIKSLGLG